MKNRSLKLYVSVFGTLAVAALSSYWLYAPSQTEAEPLYKIEAVAGVILIIFTLVTLVLLNLEKQIQKLEESKKPENTQS